MLFHFKHPCLICSRPHLMAICECCLEHLPKPPKTCQFCGQKNHLSPCPDCIDYPKCFQGIMPLSSYISPMQQIIHALKNLDPPHILPTLGDWVALRILQSSIPISTLITVPMHPKDRIQRGHHALELLVQYTAKKLSWPKNTKDLHKVKHTRKQKECSRHMRHHHLDQAFISHLSEGRFLIIDDVFTTGATLQHLSQAMGQSDLYALILSTHV